MLKTGLIGVGHLGRIHLQQLSEIPDLQVVGIYDLDPGRSADVSRATGVRSFDDPIQLIEAADMVDVVSPTPTHFGFATECLKRGKHVFIEKPLAATVEEADQIVRLTEETGLTVQVGHVERFNPAFVAARSFLDKPMFIEAHRLAQFNIRGTDVSVIFDLMIHDLDIILSLNPEPVTGIQASGVSVISDTPDIANARIEFANGCVANLTASRISIKKMRKVRFFQKNAYISVDFLKKKAEVIRLKELSGEPDPLAMVVDLGGIKGKKIIYFDNPEVHDTNAIRDELEQFTKAIRNSHKPVVTAHDGSRAVRVAHEISEKINNLHPVTD